jgi:putative PIN family toxin of toxin-antitoxin system
MYVLDTNVIVAALVSRRGASHWLLDRVLDGRLEIAVSVALALEYEDVLSRARLNELSWASARQIDHVLDGVLQSARLVTPISFRLRPILSDPDDDLVLECAVQARAKAIVTVNERDFAPVKQLYDIAIVKPGALVAELRRKGME